MQTISEQPRRRARTKKTLPPPPSPIEPEQCYSYPECAAILRISLPTLYVRLKEGRLEAVRNGRRSLILGRELTRYMVSLPPRRSKAA